MKKIMIVLMLLTSINSNLFAQQNNTDKTFDIPAKEVQRVFYIELDKGDKIKIDLGKMEDLDGLGNLDSILRIFIQDIEPLKDSLADELSSKRIDYIVDPSGKNKLRIQQFAPTGSSYLVEQGTVAAMKLEQDTVNFIFKANGGPERLFKNKPPGSHNYRISFYVNNIGNLAGYMNGRLQTSITKLKDNATGRWVSGNDGLLHAKREPSISSNMARGQINGSDYLNLKVGADIQNYKNYFVPSVSATVSIITNRQSTRREYSFTGESHFTFERNSAGKLQTFRSGFLTLAYTQTNNIASKNVLGFDPSFSIGWLARQRGSIFEKNTFRFGFGSTTLFNRVKLEPVIYFHDFFKSVTPGIRLSL